MPATKRLVLDLPEDQVDRLEAQIAAGEYGSANEAVATALDTLFTPIDEDWLRSPEGQAWLTEGDEADRDMEEGRDPGRPAAEVFAELKAELQAMADAERHRG